MCPSDLPIDHHERGLGDFQNIFKEAQYIYDSKIYFQAIPCLQPIYSAVSMTKRYKIYLQEQKLQLLPLIPTA